MDKMRREVGEEGIEFRCRESDVRGISCGVIRSFVAPWRGSDS
jgi:hypothetical protein